jgi:hypothetical protein
MQKASREGGGVRWECDGMQGGGQEGGMRGGGDVLACRMKRLARKL